MKVWVVQLVLVVVGGVAAVAGANDARVRQVFVDLRRVFLTTYSNDVRELAATPLALRERGFLVDNASAIAAFDSSVRGSRLESVIRSIRALPTSTERAVAILRSLSSPRLIGGTCGGRRDLISIIEDSQDGIGCCSDHTEAFIGLASAVHLPAREISAGTHTIVEFYSHEEERWVFIDPEFGFMAEDGAGRFVSVLMLRRLANDPTHAGFTYMGDTQRIDAASDPKWLGMFYSKPADFERITLTFGSNVLAADAAMRQVAWLPKIPAQLVGHLAGVRPPYREFESTRRERRSCFETPHISPRCWARRCSSAFLSATRSSFSRRQLPRDQRAGARNSPGCGVRIATGASAAVRARRGCPSTSDSVG